MTQVIPVTTARKNLLKLVDEIDKKYTRVDLSKNGCVKASLVSPEYLDSMEETIYTLSHSMDDIRVVEKAIAKGNFEDFVTLEEFKKDLALRKAKEAKLKKHAR